MDAFNSSLSVAVPFLLAGQSTFQYGILSISWKMMRNSDHDFMVLCCTGPFISTLPSGIKLAQKMRKTLHLRHEKIARHLPAHGDMTSQPSLPAQ